VYNIPQSCAFFAKGVRQSHQWLNIWGSSSTQERLNQGNEACKMKNTINRWVGMLAVSLGVLPCLAASSQGADTGLITFNKDIAPIIFNNCTGCHHTGEVAPFALMNYSDVRRHSHEIADLTAHRQMPPWKPEQGFGDFVGARRLTDQQIELIGQWVKQGRPEGNPSDLPPTPKFKSGWTLGEPDMIVRMPQPFNVRADGPDQYRVFVIPLNLTKDQYVTAVEYRPSNPRIVHHSLFYLDNSGMARQLEAESPDKPGYARTGSPGFVPSGGLGGWAPGVTPRFLPDGVGRPVRAGADLVLHTHFHPSGKPEKEQSMVGLYFAKKPPEKLLVSIPHGSNRIDIPAGDKDYVVENSFTLPRDVELQAVFPHAHLVCRQIKVTATLPDGKLLPLIWIKDWDWNWQDYYQYSHVLKIPAGTKVTMRFTYDNSTDNPHNPSNPPQRVRHGEQTKDEMALVFYQILIDRNEMDRLTSFRQKLGRASSAARQRAASDAPDGNKAAVQ
jgi:mono/diheme cytochrome c family protein